jgi:predicted transcriptional regulator
MSSPHQYRSALMIIQLILEELIRVGDTGIAKTQLYTALGLKTGVGEKYLEQLQRAAYIEVNEEAFGKERIRNTVRITKKGLQRFEWFIRLGAELNL